MSLKTDRINTQILREVSLILQNEVKGYFKQFKIPNP